jgi:hypothetical protein
MAFRTIIHDAIGSIEAIDVVSIGIIIGTCLLFLEVGGTAITIMFLLLSFLIARGLARQHSLRTSALSSRGHAVGERDDINFRVAEWQYGERA